jgi:hypothetical protein
LFAKAALDGVQGTPPDLGSAVDAANKAQMHMPDGSNVYFTPLPYSDGVTAAVSMPGTTKVTAIHLTSDQFKQFVDIGKAGQWDRVHSQGVPATLQSLSRSRPVTSLGQLQPPPKATPASAAAPAAGSSDAGTQQGGDKKDVSDPTPARSAFGETAAQGGWIPARTGSYSNELENLALQMFPSVGENRQRMEWMAAREEKKLERQNKLDVARQQGINAANAIENEVNRSKALLYPVR